MTDRENTAIAPDVLIPIRWGEPGAAVFSNTVVVQQDESVIHLLFYQLNPPVMFGRDEEEQKKAIEQLGSVNALPMVHIALPIEKLLPLIETLGKHLPQNKAE